MNKSYISVCIIFTLVLVCCLPTSLSGQYFIWGQDPGSTKWQQINTHNFQIIFPEGFEEQGKHLADLMEHAYSLVSKTLHHEPRKVPVIIHNQTVVSNGFVSWAPRRLEMFTNPPQNNGTHDWLEKLAVHELRHVVQIDKLNQGFIKILSYVLGEQAAGAFFGLSIPMWFAEGDAVAIETGLTEGGRGRQPSFEQGLRAQVLEKGVYNFDKAYFGSFKDYVPNYYELGYQLVAAARAEHGEDIWSKVIDNVWRKPIPLQIPFSQGLKKQTGYGIDGHYKKTFEMLDSAWRAQREKHNFTPFETLSPQNKLFTNYRYTTFINDTLIVALKTSLERPPRVVSVDLKGNEQHLFSPGSVDVKGLSAANGRVVWNQIRTNPRWEHLSYSELYLFDIAERKRTKLTKNTRLFAPALSPKGDLVAAIETSRVSANTIVVLDALTGNEKFRLEIDDFSFIMTPAWHPYSNEIAVIALNHLGKHIVLVNMTTQEVSVVFSSGNVDISSPRFTPSRNILFTGAFSGIDNIFILETETGQATKLVSAIYGATDGNVDPRDENIIWANYTADGYVIARSSISNLGEITAIAEVENYSLKFYQVLAEQEGDLVSKNTVPKGNHQLKPYSKLASLFNLHSWAPGIIDINNYDFKPGASLSFQNKLSTSVAVLAYEHDINENLGKFKLGFDYYGFFPVINMDASTGLRKASYRENDEPKELIYRENKFSFGVSQPLQYRKYNWFYGFNPSVKLAISSVEPTKTTPDFFKSNKTYAMEYRFLAYLQKWQVARDLRPRWAQIFDINYRHTPMGSTDLGSVFTVRSASFIPGLFRHHSLRLSASYQKHMEKDLLPNTINFRFPNLVAYPRGISGRRDQTLLSFSADYAFPIIYPDLSLPGIFYLKRIHANLFADRAYATFLSDDELPVKKSVILQSYGLDLVAHVNLLRFFFPFDLGVRGYYHPETKKFGGNVIFGVRM